MVLIGIDFGNDSCVVTSVNKGKLINLTNDYNNRKTPYVQLFLKLFDVKIISLSLKKFTNIQMGTLL